MMRHFLSLLVTKAAAGLVVGCALLLSPAIARAQTESPPAASASPPSGPSGPLGQGFSDNPGQIVISTDTSGGPPFTSFAGVHLDKTNGGGWAFEVRPAVDYFIMPQIAVGGVVGFGLTSDESKRFVLGARGSFNFNLTETIGFWARLGLSYTYAHVPAAGLVAAHSTNDTYLSASLPVMYHLIAHVFIGLGPYYNLNITGDGPNNYGLTTILGGWFQ